MRLHFVGAAQEVTGSCYLIETAGLRFLVDCGMHQGGREAQGRNLARWPMDPRTLDFVLLTHAHIDHSGLLPRLCAHGFKGPIYATRATADLLSVMLLDSAFIQESDWARQQRRRGHGRRTPRADNELLYTVAQAQACLAQVQGVDYDTALPAHKDVRVHFRDAGHILGSAILELELRDGGRQRKLVFSGDLGQPGRPIVRNPAAIEQADVLLVESTYGDRLHRPLEETVDELCAVIDDTLSRRQGNVIVPAFALGRTQELLVLLAQLRQSGRLPPMQVFVDSPMADKVTAITARHRDELDADGQAFWGAGRHLPPGLQVRFTQSVEESMALNRIKAGAIVIAASGMCDAGRIRHHLRHNLGRPECAIVIVGFQAEGTLGRRLVNGERRVRLLGEDHRVRASVHTIGGLSAHADRDALLGWLRGFKKPPTQTYVVHGEAATALGFAERVKAELGWRVRAPLVGEVVEL